MSVSFSFTLLSLHPPALSPQRLIMQFSDRLKTTRMGAAQDACARFQAENLRNPAVLRGFDRLPLSLVPLLLFIISSSRISITFGAVVTLKQFTF